MHATPLVSRTSASAIGVLWCYVQPTLNFAGICFLALLLDCFTAWRCNRRIYAKYKEAIQKNPNCTMDDKLRSRKMAKMVLDFSVLIFAIFLATLVETKLLSHLGNLYLANYLAAIYCVVQFVSVLENESTCNGAAWAKVLQRIVADKTERHLNITKDELKGMMDEISKMKNQTTDDHDNK